MPSMILFSNGASVSVKADAEKLRASLERDKRQGGKLTKVERVNGSVIYVASDHVAWVGQIVGLEGEAG